MSALIELVDDQKWQVAITLIQFLADGYADDQLFFQDDNGCTAIMAACFYSAPLELVQLMITKAKLDSRKRCLLVITDSYGDTALHFAAGCHSDPAVVELLIREYPQALCATDIMDKAPLQFVIFSPRSAAITSLLTNTTNALAAGDYSTLATLVHGDERTLRCLALTPDRLKLRVSLLLCIKHGYVNVRRSKRQRNEAPETGLDTRAAFAALNDNVWSHIMTFL